MVNQDDSFIREVNDEMRSDRMRGVWSRFGMAIVAIAVLIVVGTVGKVAYEYWHESSASESGDAFLGALTLARDGKTDEALASLSALEKDGYGAYPVLARMRTATLQAEKGDTAAAIATFTAISTDMALPEALRDVARLRAAYLMIDTATYEQVSGQVEQLATPQNGMRHSAREALGLSAYRTGDVETARTWFQQIVDDGQTPRNLANRAQMMLDLIAGSGKAS